MSDWLQSLKVGDEVAIEHIGGFEVLTIVGETKRTWRLSGGEFADKEIGLVTRWNKPIMPVTDGMRERIERGRLQSRLYEFSRNSLTLDQLRRIVAILDEGKGET